MSKPVKLNLSNVISPYRMSQMLNNMPILLVTHIFAIGFSF
jgi:hypothetical protein